jgi:hypothetical protein
MGGPSCAYFKWKRATATPRIPLPVSDGSSGRGAEMVPLAKEDQKILAVVKSFTSNLYFSVLLLRYI